MHHNSLFSSQLTESYQQQQQPTQQDLTPFQTKSNNNRTRSNYNSSNFIMNSFKAFMDNGDASLDEPQTFEQQFNDYCALSRTQRLLGFSVCFALGWLVSLISLIAIPQIAVRPEKFALTYTLGNMISLCSTAFLYGPCAQIRGRFAIATTRIAPNCAVQSRPNKHSPSRASSHALCSVLFAHRYVQADPCRCDNHLFDIPRRDIVLRILSQASVRVCAIDLQLRVRMKKRHSTVSRLTFGE